MLNIKDIVKQVKVPYRMNGGEGGTQQTGSNGLLSTVFLLSGYEVGWTSNDYRYIPPDGVKLDYFESGSDSSANSRRVSSNGLRNCSWWTRSPRIDSTNSAIIVLYNGFYSDDTVDNSSFSSVRPAFIIPSDTYIDENNNILTASPYNTISTLNVGDSVFFNVGGVNTEYIIVHKGNPDATVYDASCDGV